MCGEGVCCESGGVLDVVCEVGYGWCGEFLCWKGFGFLVLFGGCLKVGCKRDMVGFCFEKFLGEVGVGYLDFVDW